MNEFKQVRESLLDMLEEIDERLGKITESTISKDFSDPVTDEQGSSKSKVSPKNSRHNEIKHITQAISQIDNGTYGICLICGQPIKRERLNAAPFSSHCVHCVDERKES